MLSTAQKYAIATMLATADLQSVESRLPAGEPVQFARTINRHYRIRNGFVPDAVLRIVNG